MKHRDIMNAMGDIDFDLVEDAGRVTRKASIRRKVTKWSSLAACVCLVLVGVILLSQFRNQPPKIEPQIDLIGHSTYPENLWLPEYDLSAEGNSSSSGTAGDAAPATDAYMRGLGVVAKVIEVLPDIYVAEEYSWAVATKYHILRLEILEVLYGENIPREIYFRLPLRLDPSLDEYDCIVIGGMTQVGFEEYAMINASKNRVESFTLLFGCSSFTNRGAILPFKDGVFSLEHWKKSGWYAGKWENLTINSFCYGDERFPAWEGCTLKDTKRKIRELRDEEGAVIRSESVKTKDIFSTEEQKEILAYVKPYENGLFVQKAYCDSGTVIFTRIIGGFLTNEKIHMTDEGEIKYDGEQFTQNDLANIQNLGAFVSTLDLESLAPPHTPGYESLETVTRYFKAKYVKHNGVVYGVVRVKWTLEKAGKSWKDTFYYDDDLYYLIMPDGTCHPIESDKLAEYIGEDDIIGNIKYGVPYRQDAVA